MQRFQISKQSWRQRPVPAEDEFTGVLPIYNPASVAGRREAQSWSSRSSGGGRNRRLHLIPIAVVLCFFFLWFFSSPVYLETEEDEKIKFVPRIKKQLREKEERDIDVAILALDYPTDTFFLVSDAPNASISSLDEFIPNATSLVSHGPSISSPVPIETTISFSALLDEPLTVASKEAAPQPGEES